MVGTLTRIEDAEEIYESVLFRNNNSPYPSLGWKVQIDSSFELEEHEANQSNGIPTYLNAGDGVSE